MNRTAQRARTFTRIGSLAGVAAIAATSMAALPAATAATAPVTPGSVPPSQDPFYTAPANIAKYKPGQIVATRPVTLNLNTPVNAWQISYRSNGWHLNAELAVTTLVVPKAAWTGSGSRPAVSVQDPEDSTGTQCAPSYLMASTNGSGEDLDLNTMLANGWAVAQPDYEGPLSAWMSGPQAGHATLDGIKAIDAFQAGGLTPSTQWALDGYSGGGHATGWAAQMQPTYAPTVHLVGVAMGGTPADPTAVANYIDGTAFSGFEFAAAWGINQDNPQADLTSILNAAGQQADQQVANQCIPTILVQFAFKKIADYTTVPDPLDYPAIKTVLTEDTLGQAKPTKAPIFDYHATSDEIVPVAQDDTLVSNWCKLGANLSVERDAGNDHITEFVSAESKVITFLTNSFAGKPQTSTC